MAILPMKQTVIIKRGGDLDEWGNVAPERTVTLKCRVEEGSSLRVYQSAGTTASEVVVATARILFDKLADIKETDTIVFTNELGQTFEKTPKEINVKRGGSGKPLFTEVIV
ncbi:MAG: hypothetical protein ACJ8F5_00305 [Bacillales bacterium]